MSGTFYESQIPKRVYKRYTSHLALQASILHPPSPWCISGDGKFDKTVLLWLIYMSPKDGRKENMKNAKQQKEPVI